MRKHRISFDGLWVFLTGKGHRLPPQGYDNTSQPVPLNDHQPRAGTKRNAGARGCGCDHCTGSSRKRDIEKKIVNREISQEVNFYDLLP